MTTAGDVTAEDREWVSNFMSRHFSDECYLSLISSRIPDEMPKWNSLFIDEWTAATPSKDYNKALWLRREVALREELKAAYARFIGRNIGDNNVEELIKFVTERYSPTK